MTEDNSHNRAPITARTVIHALLVVTSVTALAGDGVNITISNNTTKDLLVTVYDLNSNPVTRLLSSQTINGFSSVSITLVANGFGEGHLSWTATTIGPDMRSCAHRDRPHLIDGGTVHVYAGSECGK